MKYIFLSLIAFSLFSCASFMPVEIENGKALGVMPMQYGRISYQGTHKISASREDIFRQARRWAAFNSTRTVYAGQAIALKIPAPSNALIIGDNMLGDIIASGTIAPILKYPKAILYWPATYYSTSIECYDGYYRITLTNFYTFGEPSLHNMELRNKQTSRKVAKEFYSRVDKQVMDLIAELNVFISSEISIGSR